MNSAPVKDWLLQTQGRICDELAALDGGEFEPDVWERGRSHVLQDGVVIEKGGVLFSHVSGDTLPPSASAARPELAGNPWEAMGVSLVIHPRNPYVPTCHANFRFFLTHNDKGEPVWWFGGGYDLTPYYPFTEDCVHWHSTARSACEEYGEGIYPRFKQQCDEYFFIRHRQEARGIGGVFFDDFNDWSFDRCFGLVRNLGESFLPAYLPIVQRRMDHHYGEREREFQLYRRGRYVEFNLVQDRGTLFGLQSGGRTESILMSMPPLARWSYRWEAEPGSPEAALTGHYLQPRDWLSEPGS